MATAGNDHRLGANEAPPAIVSVFLGDELEEILNAIDADEEYIGREKAVMKIGVHSIPRFAKDNTDRNRTSPFAFTGNKFEFRMPGSAVSIARCNIVLNTAVAESLRQFADELDVASDFSSVLHDIIKREIHEHKRIIFNGNGYDDAWIAESESRGLLNLASTPECLPHMIDEKNVELYARHKVYSRTELISRYETAIEEYSKLINIEALTMIDMAAKDFLPAVSRFTGDMAAAANRKKNLSGYIDCTYEQETISQLSELCTEAYSALNKLKKGMADTKKVSEPQSLAEYYHDVIIPEMNALRRSVDAMEPLTASDYWPCPGYDELLFGVR